MEASDLMDPHRPRFHFCPGQWMNDVIPFFWKGEYHYFFLHNTQSVQWSSHTAWGHAVSRDLVHWTQGPEAFAPSPTGPDRDGCWTGCVVECEGAFHAFYTAIPDFPDGPQLQCLATSNDLTRWEKHSANPLPIAQPTGFGPCFRDPLVWREGDGWTMLIGGDLPENAGGTAFLYRSDDLLRWDYQRPFVTCETAKTGHECECPDFFTLGETSVFLSSSGRTWWQTGTYDGQTFMAKNYGPTDGGAFYAAKTLRDDAGRRLLFGWVQETRSSEEQTEAGWSGCLSLPRVLTARADGTLGFAPPPELSSLRGRHRHWDDLHIPAGGLRLDGVEGASLEILLRLTSEGAARFGLAVRCSPDGAEQSALLYDGAARRVGDLDIPSGEGEELTLHVFVDRSVVETFLNGRVCLTQRTYPQRPDAFGVHLLAEGGAALAHSLDIWELVP